MNERLAELIEQARVECHEADRLSSAAPTIAEIAERLAPHVVLREDFERALDATFSEYYDDPGGDALAGFCRRIGIQATRRGRYQA